MNEPKKKNVFACNDIKYVRMPDPDDPSKNCTMVIKKNGNFTNIFKRY